MTRLTLIDETTPGVDRDLYRAVRERRGGNVSTLDQTLLHSEPVINGWHALFIPLAAQGKLPLNLRELAIMRLARIIRASYSEFYHRDLALRAGVLPAQLDQLDSWRVSDLFDERERAVLAYAEEMTTDIQVSDATFNALRLHLDEREIVELTVNIAGYNMIGRFTEALGLKPT